MRSPTLIALGSELRRYRLAAGNMTQGHLARLINYSEGMISNVETAQKVPRRDFVDVRGPTRRRIVGIRVLGSDPEDSGGIVKQQNVEWRKSNRSGANGGECVEVAVTGRR